MPYERTDNTAGYTYGETHALLAPLVGKEPEDIEQVVIIAVSSDNTFRVTGTVGCAACTIDQIGHVYMAMTSAVNPGDDIEAILRATHEHPEN